MFLDNYEENKKVIGGVISVLIIVLIIWGIRKMNSNAIYENIKTGSGILNEHVTNSLKKDYFNYRGEVYTIRCKDFNKVFFVGMIIKHKNSEELKKAIWATNEEYKKGLVFSVNDTAYEASGMGRLKNFKKTDYGYKELNIKLDELIEDMKNNDQVF